MAAYVVVAMRKGLSPLHAWTYFENSNDQLQKNRFRSIAQVRVIGGKTPPKKYRKKRKKEISEDETSQIVLNRTCSNMCKHSQLFPRRVPNRIGYPYGGDWAEGGGGN